MRRVSPREAELLKDPSMECKVRFRFAGQEFPPFVVFKIFRHTQGKSSKYISGKRIISPSNEAAADACKLMGSRKYYEQIVQDELQYEKQRITDETDVATMKDYMHYMSSLDETPAYFGGRNNCWRRLSLQNFPRTMIVYDIMDYAQSRRLSDRLKKELKFLLLRPQNKELWHDQLMAIANIRSSFPSDSSVTSSFCCNRLTRLSMRSTRCSSQARQKIAKMKRAYLCEKERELYHMIFNSSKSTAIRTYACYIQARKPATKNGSDFTGHQETALSQFEKPEDQSLLADEEWEHEAATLYAWSQALSLEDVG
ncbi:PREDICTED: putative uncharacterized protein CXorf58 homolog [Tinamus guttatus]|uniref:putative uncharacterized protein CXorf58 homolog n=1 Tax=Tinamus guttatus TaxID=94827 RepID=UPI00052F3E71|nr:PREDICTED: putative uncharacterized protein CXorf58 homolog [Tinamus guttatus]